MNEAINAVIAEHESLFPTRMDIAQASSETRTALEAHLRFPLLAPLIGLLEQARQNNVATSRLLLPESPQGIAVVVEWLHENPKGENRAEFVAVQRRLFLLSHMLRKARCAADMFVEGPPYDFAYPQPQTVHVPGTAVPVYSDHGQELLVQDPARIDALIGEGGALSGRSFMECLWHEQFATLHGIEREDSHRKTRKEVSCLADLTVLTREDLLLIQGLLEAKTGFTRTAPKVCLHGAYSIPLPELITKCERYCAAVEVFTHMHERRNGEILARIQETIRTGIPKIFCGRFHSVALRMLCGEQHIGLILTVPTSSPEIDDSYFHLRADARNQNYHIVKNIIPQLKAVAGLTA